MRKTLNDELWTTNAIACVSAHMHIHLHTHTPWLQTKAILNFIYQQFNSGVSKYFKLTVSKTKILHTSYITAVFISGLGIFATVSVIF